MVRHTSGLTFGLLLLLSAVIVAQEPAAKTSPDASGLAGKWEIPRLLRGTNATINLTSIDVRGNTFTGAMANFPIADGKINGNEVVFNLMGGGRPINVMTGTIYGDQLSLLIEDHPTGRPNPKLGVKHPWTAFRNRGTERLQWVPTEVSPLPFATPVSKKDGTPAAALTGRWEAPFVWGSKTCTYDFVFDASGNAFTGKAALLGSDQTFEIGDGKINGNDVSFSWLRAGQTIAQFTGTLYGDDLALLMREVGERRLPEATGGTTHPMTAFRIEGNQPWYTAKWLPSLTAPVGQIADPDFDATVAHPAYTGEQPRVVIDEAHRNFHTAIFRYKPFADLMRSDGYAIERGTQPFTAESLAGVKVLVISNASGQTKGTDVISSAFTQAECDVVREWVKSGGSLLLIADHAPYGAAAAAMAAGFGVQMGTGVAFSMGKGYTDANETFLVFSRENGLLSEHPITRGRDASERIQKVLTFTGQALSVPAGATGILKLPPGAMESPSMKELQQAVKDLKPDEATGTASPGTTTHAKATSGAQALAMPFGEGRLVILGEAGLLSAQVSGTMKMGMNTAGNDDRQFALNVMHWLSGALK